MIVWDSREAEERNALGRVTDAELEMARTRRSIRILTGLIVFTVALLLGDLALAVWLRTLVPLGGAVLAGGAVTFTVVMRRLFIAEFVPPVVARWNEAQDNHDRVFPNGDPR